MNIADFQWDVFAAIMVACVVAAIIATMWRRGTLSNDALTALSSFITATAKNGTDNSMISMLGKYCAIAVRAVEQLALSGQIEKENKLMKETAIELATSYAKADGVELGEEEANILPSLVEEAVHTMNNAEY